MPCPPRSYYRALYSALDREGPTTSSRAPMFLALLFRAMRVSGGCSGPCG